MKNHLVIPHPPVTLPDGRVIPRHSRTRFLFRHDPVHPDGVKGIGKLLDGKGQVFDALVFRHLRDGVGAFIESDEPEIISAALGLDAGEAGVVLAFRR